MRKVLFVIMTALFGLVPARAEGEGVRDVRALLTEIYRAEPEHFVWKRMADAPWGRGFEVVLVHEGRRYTVDYHWWVGGIEVYERPDGTGGEQSLDCYRDINADGLVDYGTDGMCERAPLRPFDPADPTTEFPERERWQERYDRALTALEATLEGERILALQTP